MHLRRLKEVGFQAVSLLPTVVAQHCNIQVTLICSSEIAKAFSQNFRAFSHLPSSAFPSLPRKENTERSLK